MATPPDTDYVKASRVAVGPLTDPSVMVDLSNLTDLWPLVDTSDGTKGRVFKDDGTTRLAVDWISFDDTGETGWVRAKWSGTFSGAGANTIRIYPPVAANASVAAGDAFGAFNAYDASWEMLLPLDEPVNTDAGGYVDRTSNGNDSTGVSMALTEVAGQVGVAQDFDGIADSILLPNLASLGSDFSVSVWARRDAATESQDTVLGLNTTPFLEIWAGTAVGGGDVWKAYSGTFAGSPHMDSGVTPSGWTHLVVSRISGTNTLYVDAVAKDTYVNSETFTITTPRISSRATNQLYFDGQVDDVQLHLSGRSANWWAEEFAATDDNATYWGTWTLVEAAGVQGTATSAAAFVAAAVGTKLVEGVAASAAAFVTTATATKVLAPDEDSLVELTVVMAQEQALEVVMAQEEDLEVVMAQEQALTVVI